MAVVGLDIGSVAAKGVMLDEDKRHLMLVPTGWSPRDAGRQLIDSLLTKGGTESKAVERIVTTGYGKVALNYGRAASEIKCHARGIAALCPGVGTIIDIGGQDSKVIIIDDKGRVLDFAMNDKCAAGTGRFLQISATALGLDVSELGGAERADSSIPINSMCTVFAESEIIGLLAQGSDKGGIVAGLHQSVAKRVSAMVRRLGLKGKVAFTGGVAMNNGVSRALAEELGCQVLVPQDCQYTGALGAALLAREG